MDWEIIQPGSSALNANPDSSKAWELTAVARKEATEKAPLKERKAQKREGRAEKLRLFAEETVRQAMDAPVEYQPAFQDTADEAIDLLWGANMKAMRARDKADRAAHISTSLRHPYSAAFINALREARLQQLTEPSEGSILTA